MMKQNCWEFKKCGREQGGKRSKELGVCPTVTEMRLNGSHGGRNAGRSCWVVAGTLCGGVEQGSFAQKYHGCEKCDFYRQVRQEEGSGFTLSVVLVNRLRTTPTPLQNVLRKTAELANTQNRGL